MNLHNGKLPEYRGLHALSWMIQNGENTGYLTLHRVEQGIDSGPIIAEFKFEISKKMDVNDAREQINSAIINWLPQQIRDWIGHKERYLRIQNNNLAKVYPRKKDQNLCTVNSRVEDVLNLIRAVNPPFGPGAIYQNGSDLMRICLNYGPSSSEFISRHDMREVNIQLLDGQLKVLNF